MDIKDKIPLEKRQEIVRNINEINVLSALVREKRAAVTGIVAGILKDLDLSPTMYELHINPAKDEWQTTLRPGQLVTPDAKLMEKINQHAPMN